MNEPAWAVARYPVRCDRHKSPIPPGTPYRYEHPGPRQVRRICQACTLLETVIDEPADPKETT